MDIHNIYLQIGFQLGLPGVAVYLAMLGTILTWNFSWIRRAGTQSGIDVGVLWGVSAVIFAQFLDAMFHDSFFSGYAKILAGLQESNAC